MSALQSEILSIRDMQLEDIEDILLIEQESHLYPWSEGIFRDCIRVGYYCPLLEASGFITAYGVMSVAAGEAHIFNICVTPTTRRKGYGELMMKHLIEVARSRGSQTVFLEVRPSNIGAISLYEKLGFAEVGIRKDYYPHKDGRENAVIMAIDITLDK